MIEHPVLVPTEQGLVGAIVTEPDSSPQAAVVLLHGRGIHRSGVNRLWAKQARALAEYGAVVLRADYPGTGESPGGPIGKERDIEGIREVLGWFRDRTPGHDPIVIGSCYGARIALHQADGPGPISALGLMVPPLRADPPTTGLGRRRQRIAERLGRGKGLDEWTVSALRSAAARMPVWVLVGEHDVSNRVELATLMELIERERLPIETEVIAGFALHPFRTLRSQEEALTRIDGWTRRLMDRVSVP